MEETVKENDPRWKEIETIKKTQTEGVLEVKNIGKFCGLQDYAVKFRLTL